LRHNRAAYNETLFLLFPCLHHSGGSGALIPTEVLHIPSFQPFLCLHVCPPYICPIPPNGAQRFCAEANSRGRGAFFSYPGSISNQPLTLTHRSVNSTCPCCVYPRLLLQPFSPLCPWQAADTQSVLRLAALCAPPHLQVQHYPTAVSMLSGPIRSMTRPGNPEVHPPGFSPYQRWPPSQRTLMAASTLPPFPDIVARTRQRLAFPNDPSRRHLPSCLKRP
jgi:hypothetical protein